MNKRFIFPARRTAGAAALVAGFWLQGLALAQGVAADAEVADLADAASVADLSTVVVTAAGFEQAVEDAPASITVIPREELQQKAYRDVVDALQDVPGVVITGSGNKSDISLRGMDANYTLLLVDGKRQNSRETRPNSDNSGIEQGWLPPLGTIERIEVIRGPMSSLYGSDALGGVVNIITRKVAREWAGSLRTEATLQERSHSGDIGQAQLWLAGPIVADKLGLQLYSQKMHRSEDQVTGALGGHETVSHTAKLSFTPTPEHDLTLEVNRTEQERRGTPGKTLADKDRFGNPSKKSINAYDKGLVALSHTGRWGAGTTTSYLQREKINNPGRQMRVVNTETSSMATLPLGDGHLTTLGLSYKRESLYDASSNVMANSSQTDISRYQWALYAENEWSITDAFALTTGLRLNHDQRYGNHWTPRLYGVWHASEHWTLKGGVSSAFRAPDLRNSAPGWGQVTGGGSIPPGMILGEPSLKPERSVSEEIGVVWDNRDGFNASVTAFHTDFKDRIASLDLCDTSEADERAGKFCQWQGENYLFVQQWRNVDRATLDGVEATATWQVSDALRLTANYTHTRSKQKTGENKGQPLERQPKHLFNVAANWQASEKLGIWSRLNLRARTPEVNQRMTPGFTFVDAGLSWQLRKNVTVGFAVYNLFDKQVNKANGYDLTYDGRRYWVSLTAGF